MNPNTSVAKTGCNSLNWYLRDGVLEVFGRHSLTHGRIHTKTECLRRQIFFGIVDIKRKLKTDWAGQLVAECYRNTDVLGQVVCVIRRF